MGERVLVVSLAPPEVVAREVGALRAGHPQAEVTALVGGGERRAGRAVGVNEVLDWHSGGGRSLLAEVRARRFDMVVVIHGRDQYASRAYWKAVALALASGARERAFSEVGGRVRRGPARAVAAGVLHGAVQVVQEAYVAAIGLMVLVPMLIAAGVTDLSEAIVGGRGAGAPAGRGKDRD